MGIGVNALPYDIAVEIEASTEGHCSRRSRASLVGRVRGKTPSMADPLYLVFAVDEPEACWRAPVCGNTP
jgi:hypothetical protein